jgi:hypothetical protein
VIQWLAEDALAVVLLEFDGRQAVGTHEHIEMGKSRLPPGIEVTGKYHGAVMAPEDERGRIELRLE